MSISHCLAVIGAAKYLSGIFEPKFPKKVGEVFKNFYPCRGVHIFSSANAQYSTFDGNAVMLAINAYVCKYIFFIILVYRWMEADFSCYSYLVIKFLMP